MVSINNNSTGQKDFLDKCEYSKYSSPILVFGTYIKNFTRNTTCLVQDSSGDTGGGLAMHLGASRKCDEELDNWYYGADYAATMHGLTIGYGGNLPSNDSYGLSVAGAWPEGYRSWLGPNGHDFDGDEFKLGQRQGSTAAVNEQAMIAEWWQQPSSNAGYVESVKLWSQVDGVSGNSGNPNSANGQDISYWLGPRQSSSPFKVDGWFESAITFNPSWSKSGIALCGSQSAQFIGLSNAGSACLTVDNWGNTSISGSVAIGNGLTVKGGTTTLGDVVVTSLQENLQTPSSSSADCQEGQFMDDANYHYVCVKKNTWRRVALSDF